jgi:hypothetical protein
MLAFAEIPASLEALADEARTLARGIREHLGETGTEELLEVGADAIDRFGGHAILVLDGALKLSGSGKLVRLVNEGDLFVVPPAGESTLQGDFATRLLVWEMPRLLNAIHTDASLCELWNAHRELELRILQGLCAVYVTEHVEPATRLQRAGPGDHILREGEPADEIYVLIAGEATVLVEGVEVGRIHQGEVFGEMGFFTDQRRTASVLADAGCTLQRVSRDDFERLVATRPQLATTMLRTMAERVVAVNARLVRP